MSEYVWTPQQQAAIDAVTDWLANPRGPQVFRLFGFAGTGKTTLAIHLASLVRGPVVFAAYTGKAALVMRKKGCTGASTLHSAMYRTNVDSEGRYSTRVNPDSALRYAALTVIDEVSMINETQGRELLSFGRKVLVLGDPFQLPPVKGEGYFVTDAPDVLLTDVRRQDADNPILKMSIDIREGRDLVEGRYGQSRIIARDDLRDEAIASADQILCGLNRTRNRLNQKMRQWRGLQGSANALHPAQGDRLVCLRNNHEKGLLNGSLWEVADVREKRGLLSMHLASLDESGVERDVVVPEEFFMDAEDTLPWSRRKLSDEFTFGWALTVHKAQGSAWDDVLLYDEGMAFRENASRWLYTGVTRAAERITVVLP